LIRADFIIGDVFFPFIDPLRRDNVKGIMIALSKFGFKVIKKLFQVAGLLSESLFIIVSNLDDRSGTGSGLIVKFGISIIIAREIEKEERGLRYIWF